MAHGESRQRRKPPKKRVTFRLDEPEAHEVSVAGDFNNWNPSAHQMKRSARGSWSKAIMLPPGRYEYKFFVNGKWRNDPANDQLLANIFGTMNNLLVVR
jgi:5'-AMP-activated protein kinase regulatory beta subunit